MATVMQQDKAALLRNTLKVNALASGGSGLIMLVGANILAPFMSVDNPMLLMALGVGLLIFAAGVFRSAIETPLDANKGKIIFVLDIVWVVGSWLLLMADPLTLTNEGKWIVLILADIVAVFAVFEYFGLRRLR
jgi:hypothetical protein